MKPKILLTGLYQNLHIKLIKLGKGEDGSDGKVFAVPTLGPKLEYSPLIKSLVHICNPSARGRQIPRAHWPARVAKSVSSREHTQGQPLASTCIDTHMQAYSRAQVQTHESTYIH